MADSNGKIVLLAGGGGWIDGVAVVGRGDRLVEVFQEHRERGVLHFELGFGEIATLGGRAVEGMRVLEFLGKAEELERGFDLAG